MSQKQDTQLSLPWKLPKPSTYFVEGPRFSPGNSSSLTWTYEDTSDKNPTSQVGIFEQRLIFSGVQAYRCTYSLLTKSEIVKLAYDTVTDLGATDWLSELLSRSYEIDKKQKTLRHVAIFFDEGPCYEFICEKVSVSEPQFVRRLEVGEWQVE